MGIENEKFSGKYWWRKALFLSGVSVVIMSPVLVMDPAIAEATPAKGEWRET
jgi:hypothetical protein